MVKPGYTPPIHPSVRTKGRIAGWLQGLLVIIIIFGSVAVGLMQIQAPSPVPADAPREQFSSERAMQKLAAFAQEPHPTGSAEHDRVRDYLINELQQLGLTPQIQKSAIQNVRWVSDGYVENIYARIPGKHNSKAVMLAAHYDSVPEGPGAADDGAAIAAMLETIRALQSGPPLDNDVIVLMTDGEELGLEGAKAWMSETPWAQDIGLVLNFDARGNKGPVFMFETSDQNGWLIREFIKAAPQPIGYSLIYNIYKLMPNDTDLTVFKRHGLAGLNFAFGMGLNAYHTDQDTVENLDESSVQHHGDYMLSLTRHFGNLDVSNVREQDAVYFNIIGSAMVVYGQQWVIPLMIMIAAIWLFVLIFGLMKKRVSLLGVLGGLLLALLAVALTFGVITGIWKLAAGSTASEQYEQIVVNPAYSHYYFIGLLFIAGAFVFSLYKAASLKIRTENLWLGTLTLWTLLMIATAFQLPGGSYLFMWPLLFSLVGLFAVYHIRPHHTIWSSVISAIPGFVLFAPIIYLVYSLLTLHKAGVLLGIAALAITLIIPVFTAWRGKASWIIPSVLFLAGVGILITMRLAM